MSGSTSLTSMVSYTTSRPNWSELMRELSPTACSQPCNGTTPTDRIITLVHQTPNPSYLRSHPRWRVPPQHTSHRTRGNQGDWAKLASHLPNTTPSFHPCAPIPMLPPPPSYKPPLNPIACNRATVTTPAGTAQPTFRRHAPHPNPPAAGHRVRAQ